MLFNERSPYSYGTAMDREYSANMIQETQTTPYTGASNLERPVGTARSEPTLAVDEIGQTVAEGRAGGGTFIESVQAALRKGAASVELSAQMEGQEPGTGVASYGVQKRRELREMARANEINVASVHTPSQIGNLSGFAGPEKGFVDEQREMFLNEVKKAVNFAADVTNGGAVVVHTGEYQRPISEEPWAKDKYGRHIFKQYEEEPQRAIMRIVDDRTGQVIQQVRKNQEVYRPEWLTADNEYTYTDEETGQQVRVNKGDYVDYEGRKVDIEHRVPLWEEESGKFKVRPMRWEDFVEEANERNQGKPKDQWITPEQGLLHATIETQAGQARGWAMYHGMQMKQVKDQLDKAKQSYEYWKKVEDATPEEEKWKLKKSFEREGGLMPPEYQLPTELLNERIESMRKNIEHIQQATVGYEQQAMEQELFKKHAVPISQYAKKKSMQSYAEAGVYAMDQTKARQLSKPVFVAPENIFPEMGYGSHPQEMIDLVQNARKAMADKLMNDRGLSQDKAKKMAREHIKTTLDTEHIGMWKRYFQKKPGESEEQFNKRFNNWYMEQVKEMEKADIIGHVHIADGFGYGHANLPAGHGDMPVVDAVSYLKKKGYEGAFLSEGYGDASRMLREAWKTFGTPIYSASGPVRPGAQTRWSDVQQSYFGQGQTPMYIFGTYSPSNDWQLWSQVPME
ncbi:MAG: hypothetical protein R6U32_00205 [Candidatus Woesearchaeota archaeon]